MINPQVHIPYHRIEDYLIFIKENQINLEIYFSSHFLDTINNSDIIDLKEKLDYHPSLTVHAPFMDLSPGAVDSKVRAVTIERFSHIFEISKILNPKIIVFHSGYEKWKYAQRIDIWLEGSLITWKPLIKRAHELDVKIALENIFEEEPTNLTLLMQELGSEYFGLCFDTGHFNLFSKTPLEEWLNYLKPYIIELHLHDNDKTADTHKPIGDGTFDFNTLFSILKDKDLIYTIESHNTEDAIKSIEKLKKYL
ncbi:MAG: sugar phosphate isomerase/epimerase [Nitrospirota bacterium]|nr:sugar phosphate isomerase/epimerase [Nitrospirota bacterium]MDH5768332.1 sugar phosphate isomerase/epimerase [Nitrospirota bacterium]